MRIPLPSEGANPSRPLSNGRLAWEGSPDQVERARMVLNPPMPISQIPASVPPVTITSASPRRITSAASPIACVLAAQAVTHVFV